MRGRTIYALPDRVAYGYFDMLTRFLVESGEWNAVASIPVVAMLFFTFIVWVAGQLRTNIWSEHSPRMHYRDVPETITLRESPVATATATNVNSNALPVAGASTTNALPGPRAK